MDFALENKRIDSDNEKIRLSDVDSARKRDTEVSTSDKVPLLNKIIQPILALFITVGTFALFWYIFASNNAIEATRKDILIFVIGNLTSITIQVIAYYFGSSKESSNKSQTIDKLIK